MSIKFFIFILILNIVLINSKSNDDNDDNEEFLDIGVQLRGDKQDVLVADLIAEERNVLNVGHVSRTNCIGLRIRMDFFRFLVLICIIFVFEQNEVDEQNEQSIELSKIFDKTIE